MNYFQNMWQSYTTIVEGFNKSSYSIKLRKVLGEMPVLFFKHFSVA